MSEFELLAIPIYIILGLGIAHVLQAIAESIRARDHVTLDWIPIVWAVSIFLICIEYFFVLWDLNQMGRNWTWAWYGPPLFHSLLFFLAASLVLPFGKSSDQATMSSDFQRHGRYALIPFGLSFLFAFIANWYQFGATILDKANWSNGVLLVLLIVAFFRGDRRMRGTASVLFILVELYSILFIWSQPGN